MAKWPVSKIDNLSSIELDKIKIRIKEENLTWMCMPSLVMGLQVKFT